MFRFPRDHIVFIRSQILAFPLLAYSSHAEFEDSFVVKCSLGTYNYSLSQFHSIKNPFSPEPVCPPFLKVITFVLSRFTVSPESSKLFLDCLSVIFRRDGVEDIRKLSSSNNERNIFWRLGSN